MTKKILARTVLSLAALAAVVALLFEVSLDPQFALPREVQRPDPAQETRFADCLAERDAVIHERAFSTIDNPDVQREFISTERDKAQAACRATFPLREITEQQPFRFRLLDLDFRF